MTSTRKTILLWVMGFIIGFGGAELVKLKMGFYDKPDPVAQWSGEIVDYTVWPRKATMEEYEWLYRGNSASVAQYVGNIEYRDLDKCLYKWEHHSVYIPMMLHNFILIYVGWFPLQEFALLIREDAAYFAPTCEEKFHGYVLAWYELDQCED